MEQGLFDRAVALFNRGSFFDAHETWEDVWRESSPPNKKFLQGLIQVAVAFHHHSKGNIAGARSLLARACKNLDRCPDGFGGIQVSALLESLAHWQSALAEGKTVPPLPRL